MNIKGTQQSDVIPKLPGIILLSHGPLCSGLLGSLNLIYGEVENVTAIELEEGDSPDDYQKQFAELYEELPPQSIFLIDVFGGTPCNEVLKYFLEKELPIRAVCGVNLGMLMEACVKRTLEEEDFLLELQQIGQDCIMNVGVMWNQQV